MPFKMLTKSVVGGTQFGEEAKSGVHHNGESFAQQEDNNRLEEDGPAATSSMVIKITEENKKDQKVKPFQVQLIKVNSKKKKKKKGATTDQTANVVNVLKNVSQTSADISNLSKRELMQHLKSKLDSIQTQADSMKQNLYGKEVNSGIREEAEEEEKNE